MARTKSFLGECVGVKLMKRQPNDNHILLEVSIEDDETWFPKMVLSSSWIDEFVEVLQLAKSYIETQDPDISPHDGKQYGFKFKD